MWSVYLMIFFLSVFIHIWMAYIHVHIHMTYIYSTLIRQAASWIIVQNRGQVYGRMNFFFGVYISRLLHSSKHSDFPVVVSNTPKNLRYSEMFWKTRLFDRHQNLNVAWKLVHLIYKRIYIYNTERPKQNGVLGGDAAVMTGYT